MSFFLFPRHFDDVEVPIVNGKKLYVAKDDKFEYYLHWLADHFYTENSKKVINDSDYQELKGEAICLANKGWYHLLYCFEPFVTFIEENVSYKETLEIFKDQYEETYRDISNEEEIDDFNDWINPEVWENAKREYAELSKISGSHFDLGYRRQLRKLLEGVVSHEQRFEIVKAFYFEYLSESSK